MQKLLRVTLPTFTLAIVIAIAAFVSPQGVCAAGGSCKAEVDLVQDAPVFIEEIPDYQLEQPLAGVASVKNFGQYIIIVYRFGIGLVGIIAVVLIMFGGFRWVASAGNEQIISSAKETIVAAVSGLIIALLSYSILLYINPKLLALDVAVMQIPKVNICGFEAPSVISIPTITTPAGTSLDGRGHQACPGLVDALKEVADNMHTDATFTGLCSNCTIGVSSGFRSTQRQQELYDCYMGAVANGVKDGSSCPSGCGSCNLAAEPCCSNHEKGTAVDLFLSGVNVATPRLIAASSEGFAKAKYNNGGGDAALAANQKLLQDIMTSTGKFKPISAEWWHFDYTGSCASTSAACTPGATGSAVGNAYCVSGGGGALVYEYAGCKAGKSSCDALYAAPKGRWSLVAGGCDPSPPDKQYYEFNSADKGSSGWLKPPTCKLVTNRAPSGANPGAQ